MLGLLGRAVDDLARAARRRLGRLVDVADPDVEEPGPEPIRCPACPRQMTVRRVPDGYDRPVCRDCFNEIQSRQRRGFFVDETDETEGCHA